MGAAADQLCFVAGFLRHCPLAWLPYICARFVANPEVDHGELRRRCSRTVPRPSGSCYFSESGPRYAKFPFIQKKSIPVASLWPHTLHFSRLRRDMGW